jgi:peptide/nickel transport system substrate-binding protein
MTKGRTMSMTRHRALATLLAGGCALALAACGGGGGGKGKFADGLPKPDQKRGGTITLLSSESFVSLDPGASYFQLDYEVVYDTQRLLYSWLPDKPATAPGQPTPDLAGGPPRISKDLKTLTIRIKPGIRYSPGTVNRPVEAQDFKFALERGLNASVANGYESVYFHSLRGFAAAENAGDGRDIPGIQTPDSHTLVLQLDRPDAAVVYKALTLPISAPVPREYAAPLDKAKVSVYTTDPTRQAFTGPYVVKSFSAGKSLVETRNRNWDPKTDYRPAYPDRIEWKIGVDPNVAGRQILRGKGLLSGDTPAATAIKDAVQRRPGQISFTPLGNRYVAFNTRNGPFTNENLRKAVGAVLDRKRMRTVRGGPVIGDLATHLMSPDVPGFAEAGGEKGFGFDWLRSPTGDIGLATRYMKKAGYPSGRYTGAPIVVLGDNESPAKEDSQIVQDGLQRLGFKVKLRLVDHADVISKFCGSTAAMKSIAVCPTVGWIPDFPDPQPMLDPTFNGENIVPVNNNDIPLLDDPAINRAMDRAAPIADSAQRRRAWGDIDRQVTATAAAIPWLWDRTPNTMSKDVVGVIAKWNAAFQPSFCSLKR